MAYTDKTITCADCGTAFTFTEAEQELFAQRGYTNEPKRCAPCRAARKSERFGSTGGGSSSNENGGRRQMFPATCAQCGKDTEVPFQPRDGRPVYCSDCYSKIKVTRPER